MDTCSRLEERFIGSVEPVGAQPNQALMSLDGPLSYLTAIKGRHAYPGPAPETDGTVRRPDGGSSTVLPSTRKMKGP